MLVQERMESPVACLAAQTGGASLEQDRSIGLGHYQKRYDAEECRCDQGDPCRPAPAQV